MSSIQTPKSKSPQRYYIFLVPSIPSVFSHSNQYKPMASSPLLQLSTTSPHHPSRSSSIPFVLPTFVHTSSLSPTKRASTTTPSIFAKSKFIRRSTVDDSYLIDAPPPPSRPVSELKLKLLNAVSGLNRGLAASEEDLRSADDATKELEAAGGIVDLSEYLDKLQGRWKLIYSSAFSNRTLGGSRPGPSIGSLLPIALGQVFQRIDAVSKDFDNIVELQLGTPWPFPPVELTATLAHKFELIGSAKIRIVFEKTTVKTRGNLSQLPPLEVPRIPDALRPPSNTGSGEFEVTYLDNDTRITRGDRGELRVFLIS